MEEKLRNFAVDLFKIDAFKFGEYKTKIGLMTPVYCDLRMIVSYPKLMDTLADLLVDRMKTIASKFEILCGVPYTALPIATAVSLKTSMPMVMRRKESKSYGTKKLIEGQYNPGDNCLIIEDVVTSGSSILETVKDLKEEKIECRDAIVLLNREQGGAQFLKERGIEMHALFTLTQLVRYLREADLIEEDAVEKVERYIADTKVDLRSVQRAAEDRLTLTYLERSTKSSNSMASNLLRIMHTKKSNLCVAADLTNCTDILNLAERVGPHISLLKLHVDILEDFHENFVKALKSVAENHNFLLFEDRKFADIGKTVQLQYSEGLYKISSWASIVTCHSLTGKGVLDAIKGSLGLSDRGVFLLAETSAAGNLIDQNYAQATVKLALEYPDLVVGIVCQSPLFLDKPGLIQLTPGVQLDATGDGLSQQYNTPETVISKNGCDVAVVGRGITQSSDPGSAALKYKTILWQAYENRIKKSNK